MSQDVGVITEPHNEGPGDDTMYWTSSRDRREGGRLSPIAVVAVSRLYKLPGCVFKTKMALQPFGMGRPRS